MAEPILKVKNLNVRLENEIIVKDLSFEVEEGDVLTVLGPNGAGRSPNWLRSSKITVYKRNSDEC
jgi:ABC-type Mn2+/Zn2+ transport system ATPase subunit